MVNGRQPLPRDLTGRFCQRSVDHIEHVILPLMAWA
jgi:hypothetical protein